MQLVRRLEGVTELLVPKESFSPAPPTLPVFYNPAASVNRSVSVAVVDASGGGAFCDALAGMGARGIRVLREPSARKTRSTTLVDINRDSIRLGRRNAAANGVAGRCEFVAGEANSFLYSRYGRDEKFDHVDIDPFGTPVPYLQAALRAVKDGGVLSLTATDTAVLCGVHVRVAERRYGGTPINNHFHHETALRLLLGAVRRQAAALDLGVQPLLAHSTLHYLRAYVRVEVGATEAEAGRRNEGSVGWCRKCGELASGPVLAAECPACGAKWRVAGPLWLGPVTDRALLGEAVASAEALGLGDAAKVLASLRGVDEFPPWSFSVEGVCSSLRIPGVSDAVVAELLGEAGFRTMKQPFEKTGLKTDAPYRAVSEAVKGAAARRGR